MIILVQQNFSDPMNAALAAAVRTVLRAGTSEPVTVYEESLHLQDFPDPKYQEALETFLREKYHATNMHLIITLGPGPLRFMLRSRSRLWAEVPIFAALDEIAAARLSLPPNVVARTYRLTLEGMITAARAVVPGLERVVVLGNRFDNVRARLTDELQTHASEFEIIDLRGSMVSEIRKRVATLPQRTAILHTGIERDEANYASREALTAILEVANSPVIVDTESALGFGAVGGFVVDPTPIGEEAAYIALRILGGQSVSQVTVQSLSRFSRPIFDWRQLQRWGVSESTLPSGSEVRFREPTVWELYRWQIELILLAQALLIVALFYERRRRRKAEAVSRERLSELAHMNRRRTAGELSASIAHEIKQPLTVIAASGSAGLRWIAKATPDLGEARMAFERVIDAALRAGNVIDTIRSMLKKSDDAKSALNCSRLITDVLEIARINLERRKISVETRLSTGLPKIMGSRVQLQQVILNLIVNGADALDPMTNSNRRLRITAARQEPSSVLITVEDSGPGMSPENIRRVFEPFYTTKPEGMGMGLTICRSIVEAHGGSLVAARSLLGGLAMQISLPATENSPALLVDVDAAE